MPSYSPNPNSDTQFFMPWFKYRWIKHATHPTVYISGKDLPVGIWGSRLSALNKRDEMNRLDIDFVCGATHSLLQSWETSSDCFVKTHLHAIWRKVFLPDCWAMHRLARRSVASWESFFCVDDFGQWCRSPAWYHVLLVLVLTTLRCRTMQGNFLAGRKVWGVPAFLHKAVVEFFWWIFFN